MRTRLKWNVERLQKKTPKHEVLKCFPYQQTDWAHEIGHPTPATVRTGQCLNRGFVLHAIETHRKRRYNHAGASQVTANRVLKEHSSCCQIWELNGQRIIYNKLRFFWNSTEITNIHKIPGLLIYIIYIYVTFNRTINAAFFMSALSFRGNTELSLQRWLWIFLFLFSRTKIRIRIACVHERTTENWFLWLCPIILVTNVYTTNNFRSSNRPRTNCLVYKYSTVTSPRKYVDKLLVVVAWTNLLTNE
jgi:hypothetical protein